MCNIESRACGRNDCVKQRHPLVTAKFGTIIHHTSETCKIMTSRKSYYLYIGSRIYVLSIGTENDDLE